MSWTVVVPLKQGADNKSRLAERLSADERVRLSAAMAARVLARVAAAPAVSRLVALAPERPAGPYQWRADGGAGLNAELEAARAALGPARFAVVFADLPRLEAEDVAALLAAAERAGAAIAPDRHDAGTNALALADARGFVMGFGAGSFARHRRAAPHAAIVRRAGLGFDLDTPEDLHTALASGWLDGLS